MKVKRTKREITERKKRKSDKKREKTRQKGHVSVGNFFPPSSANPFFEISKAVTSRNLGPFFKMHNFNGIVQQ